MDGQECRGGSRLAERQGQLAGDLLRRNRQVARVVDAVGTYSPREGADRLVDLAIADARLAFGLIDARIVLGDPSDIPADERVPGDPLPVRADLRAGAEPLGALVGHAPATARWDRADQDLLELFAAVVGVGLRNAELFARVADQNERLRELDAAKDDFLRGVSHNLQTPLARIRAYADQLAAESPDRRLGIIAEQSDRLSRMVRQLLTVSRLDSGVLHPVPGVFAPAGLVRRAWEALGASGVPFRLDDRAGGWLALADPDLADLPKRFAGPRQQRDSDVELAASRRAYFALGSLRCSVTLPALRDCSGSKRPVAVAPSDQRTK